MLMNSKLAQIKGLLRQLEQQGQEMCLAKTPAEFIREAFLPCESGKCTPQAAIREQLVAKAEGAQLLPVVPAA